MAPRGWPDEVDVFTVPHARMKMLVHQYIDMMTRTDFADTGNLTSVLQSLLTTFQEFMAHEQIENKFIMHKLKAKMQARAITNMAVCNCHNDNRLSEMLHLVEEGYDLRDCSARERLNFGRHLCQALDEFTSKFLPHMKEEEEIFQPLLMEYFSYEELCEIKTTVIQQHSLACDLEGGEEKLTTDRIASEQSEEQAGEGTATEALPDELLLVVMSFLSPQDLARCAQVSSRWAHLAMDPLLWSTLQPVAWAEGNWTFSWSWGVEMSNTGCFSGVMFSMDDDADVDESPDSDDGSEDALHVRLAHHEARLLTGLLRQLLPRVGLAVRRCSLAGSRAITNSMVRKILKLCPNLTTLDLSHTGISDEAFKGLAVEGQACSLQEVSLAGCTNITDLSLTRLAVALCPPQPSTSVSTASASTRASTAGCLQLGCSSLPRGCCGGAAVPALGEQASELCWQTGCEWPGSFSPAFMCGEAPPMDRDGGSAGVCCKGSGGSARTTGFARCGTPHPPLLDQAVGALSECCLSDSRNSAHRGTTRTGSTVPACSGRLTLDSGTGDCGLEDSVAIVPRLRSLNLSGCYRLTDSGLRELSGRGGLPWLEELDLSGCPLLTGAALQELVALCGSLDLAQLFYCDNMEDDPFKNSASGCRNLECSARYCCRWGD